MDRQESSHLPGQKKLPLSSRAESRRNSRKLNAIAGNLDKTANEDRTPAYASDRSDDWILERSVILPAVSQRSWAAAVAARAVGASVTEVVGCLWLEGADVPRARREVKRLPFIDSSGGKAAVDEALARLARVRVYEAFRPLWDSYYDSVFGELNPAVNAIGPLEDVANSLIEELALVCKHLAELDRVSVGAHRKPVLYRRAEQICDQLIGQFQRMLDVLERISALIGKMTTYTDAGLLQAGYTPKEILELGAAPRSARSVYRRKQLPGRPSPSSQAWIDDAIVEAFASGAKVLTPGSELYEDWSARVLAHLTGVQKCRVDIAAAYASGALQAVAQPVGDVIA
jgi:hypothetical protein